MTIPIERTNAVMRAVELLRRLTDPSKTPRVPRDIRREAAAILRHTPTHWDMKRAAEKAPDVFGSEFVK